MGAHLDILQLDTQFPRIPGDVASAETYACDVNIHRIERATVKGIVRGNPAGIEIAPFEHALAKCDGALTATSCGFLSYWQDHLAGQSRAPFVSSALIDLPLAAQKFSPENFMILTFDEAALGVAHLPKGYAQFEASIVGLSRDMHLRRVIEGDLPELDIDLARAELVEFSMKILAPRQPKGLMLECTNLPPYKDIFRQVLDVEIFDILTAIEARMPGAVKPEFLG